MPPDPFSEPHYPPVSERRTGPLLGLRARAYTLGMAARRRRALRLARRSRRLADRAKRLQKGIKGRPRKEVLRPKQQLSQDRKARAKTRGDYSTWLYVLEQVGSQEALRLLLGAGLFGRSLPRQLAEPEGERLLVLVPHQDDEGIGAAGTLLLAARAGKRIRIVYYTDGGATLGRLTPEELSQVRYREARRAWGRVPGVELEFLGYPAGGRGLVAESVGELARVVEEFGPDTILLPNFLEEPPDHRLLNRWLMALDTERPLGPEVEVWGYQVTSRVPGNAVVDITGVWKEKLRLNRAWASQNAFIDYSHLAMGQDIANSLYLKGGRFLKSTRSHAEVFVRFDAPEYLALCERFFALADAFEASLEPGATAAGER